MFACVLILGATLASYWISWILWFFFEMSIIAFLIALFGKITDVFKYSDMSIMFFYFLGMTLSISGLSMVVSTLFDNPKIASLFGCVLWMVSLLSGNFYRLMDEDGRGWFCLLSPACINVSLNNLSLFEQALLGIQWDNVSDTVSDFKFSTAIIMFYVDYVIYVLLALYLDRVFPSRYGSKLPYYFCCVPSFWGFNSNINANDTSTDDTRNDAEALLTNPTYEDMSDKYSSIQPSIQITHLRKVFYNNFYCISLPNKTCCICACLST